MTGTSTVRVRQFADMSHVAFINAVILFEKKRQCRSNVGEDPFDNLVKINYYEQDIY